MIGSDRQRLLRVQRAFAVSEDQVLGNIDYNLNSKHRLNGNFFYSSDPQTASFTTSNVPGSGLSLTSRIAWRTSN